MSEHRHPLLTCTFQGCFARRFPDSVMCSGHWRLMSYEQRHALQTLLYVLAAAAVEANQERFDAARQAVFDKLTEMGPMLDARLRGD